MKKLILLLLLFLAPAYAQAQIVGQGGAGTENWLVTSTPASAVTNSGTLSGAGQNVTLTLLGRTGAGARLVLTGFSGQLNAYASFDGSAFDTSVYWGEVTGGPRFSRVSVLETDNIGVWFYVPPGATHVRLYAAALTAGTVGVVLNANDAQLDPLALVSSSNTLTNSVTRSIQIGGAPSVGGEWLAAAVTPAAPGDSAAGLVVRNRSGYASIQTGPATSNDGLANVLSIRDATSGNTMEPAIRTDAALTGDRGILVRTIPSTTLSQLVNAASLPLPTNASVETGGNLAAAATSLAVMDDWDETDRAKVNLIVGQAGVSAGSGVIDAATQRFVPASNSVMKVTGVGSGAVAIDISTSVPIDVNPISGASTSALQTTGNTSLGTIKTNTDPLVASGAGAYVRQDSNATIAKETGGNLAATATSVASIDSKLTAPLSTISKVALTANAPATASVGVASASAVSANASRKGLLIVNVSNATVCLGLASAAVLNSGICLQPSAAWSMNEYSFVTGAINAIASAAASTISIQELQ